MILKIILVVILLVVIFINLRNKKVYETFISTYKADITLPIIAPYSFAIIDKLNLYRRMPKLINTIHQKMIILRGSRLSGDYTKIYLGKILTSITLALFFSIVFVVLDGGSYSKLLYGFVFTGIIGFYLEIGRAHV